MLLAFTHDPLVHWLLCVALAALFASAAFHKLRDLAAFREAVQAYRIVPAALLPAAPAMAALELGLAIALVAPRARPAGAFGVALLLVIYSTAIAVNLLRGRRDVECGCAAFGSRQRLSEWLLARNALLAAAALATLAIPGERTLLWIDWISLAGGLAVLGCAWVAAHRLIAAADRSLPAGVSR